MLINLNLSKLFKYFILALVVLGSPKPLYAAGKPLSITVMTLNLHNGKDPAGVSNLDRFLELVYAKQPDIIALQEVERRALKKLELTGYQIIPGMNANLPFFRFGNVILTKHKVIYHRHLYLPSNREQRGINEVAIEIEGRYFRVINTHIGLGWAEQEQQLNEIIRITNYFNEPLLIVGDFNLEPSNKLLKDFRFQQIGSVFSLPKTFPTKKPRYLIDLIWYSMHWRPVEAEILPWDGSDHFPVLSRLALNEPYLSPIAEVEIPDLTKEYNPLLPDIGGTRYQANITGVKDDNSEEINCGGTLYLNNILLGIESNNGHPLFSVGVTKNIDLRDYASLWGVRGKAQWSLIVSTTFEEDPWFTWEQYYRWSGHWGTRITANFEAEPEFRIGQMYLPSEKWRYRLEADNDHGFVLGLAVTPDKRQVFELQRYRENDVNRWALSWSLQGFK